MAFNFNRLGRVGENSDKNDEESVEKQEGRANLQRLLKNVANVEVSRLHQVLEEVTDAEVKKFLNTRTDLTHKEVAFKFIEKGHSQRVIKCLHYFTDLTLDDRKEVMREIFTKGEGEYIIKQFHTFTVGLDSDGRKELVLELLTMGTGMQAAYQVVEQFSYFTAGIDSSGRENIVSELICMGIVNRVAELFPELTVGFSPINRKAIIAKFIEARYGSYTARYFSSLSEVKENFNHHITLLIRSPKENFRFFAEHFSVITANSSFEDRKDSILEIAKMGQPWGEFIAKYLPYLTTGSNPEDAEDPVLKVIGTWEGWGVGEEVSDCGGIREEDHEEIALTIIESGGGYAVADYFSYFTGITERDYKDFASKIIAQGEKGCQFIIEYFNRIFTDIDYGDRELIVRELIKRVKEGLQYRNFNGLGLGRQFVLHFPDLTTGIDFRVRTQILLELENYFYYTANWNLNSEIAERLPELTTGLGSDGCMEIMFKVIERGSSIKILERFSDFTDITERDHEDIAREFIRAGDGKQFAKYFSQFTGIKDQKRFVSNLLELRRKNRFRVGPQFLAEFLHIFTDISPKERREMMPQLIEHGGAKDVARHFFLFHFDSGNDALGVLQKLLKREDGDIPFAFIAAIARKLPGKYKEIARDNDTVRCVLETDRIFGSAATNSLYRDFSVLYSGGLPKLFQGVGIEGSRKKGPNRKGLKQLEDVAKAFRKQSIYSTDAPKGDLFKILYKGFVRFDTSEFGLHDTVTFENRIEAFERYRRGRDYVPLNERYIPSDVLQVHHRIKRDYKPSREFEAQFDSLTKAIAEAKQLLQHSKEPLLEGSFRINTVLEVIKNDLEKSLAEAVKERDTHPERKGLTFKVENIEQQMKTVEKVQIQRVEDLRDNLTTLQKYKSKRYSNLHHSIRVFLFAFSLKRNPQYADEDLHDLGEVRNLLNFVNHITKQETLSAYFKSDEERSALENLINTAALDDHVERLEELTGKSEKKDPIRFVPTRNLLTEFSGNFADACWVDEYSSTLREFPNLISLAFVQEETGQLLGAAILFETETENGERLLIIRGINPIQKVVDKLYVEDFCDQLFSYVKEIAQKDGREAAVAIDDHCGGHDTNRPDIFVHLQRLQKNLEPIRLGKEAARETDFNDYNLEYDPVQKKGVYRLPFSG